MKGLIIKKGMSREMKRSIILIFLGTLICLFTGLVQAGSGGTLTVGMDMDIKQLDPGFISDLPSQMVASQIHDYLIYRDTEGSFKANLATDWEVSEDGKNWTFYLKKGVKFTDGSDFNAGVVKWHFDRLRDKEVASNYVEQFKVIKEINIVDDYTVQFVLERSYGPFIDTILLSPGGLIPSKKHFEEVGANQYATNPVGTGPFIFEEWQPENYVLLKKNPDYHRTEVQLDALKFKPIAEAMTRVIELQTGGIDFLNTVSYTEIDHLKQDNNIQVFEGESRFYLMHIWLNQNDGSPFKDNLPLRQSVVHAIDRNQVSQLLYGDYGLPCKSYVPVSSWAYPENSNPVEFNPEKAKEILKDAGYTYQDEKLYKDGERVKIEYLSTTSENMWSIIAQYVQEALRDIGIEVAIKQLEWGSYLDIFTGTKEFDISAMGWVQDTGEPTLFLDTLVKTNGRGNFTTYSNQEVDKLLDQAAATSDIEKRKELYNQVYQLLEKDLPMHPLVSEPLLRAVNKRVKGYIYSPYATDYTQIWLEN